MGESLRQQVNLYQPAFRKQRQVFSAATMLQSVAVITIALVTIYAFGLFQVGALEAQVDELEGMERAKSVQLASVDTAAGPARRAEVEHQLESLNERLADQDRLIESLRSEPPGSSSGFSRYLTALARERRPGVWLTNISVNGASEALELRGRSLDVQRVPDYLAALTREAALNGQRFDEFSIDRTNEAGVVFHVTSSAVSETQGARPERRP